MIQSIFDCLSRLRLPLNDEKRTQVEIATAFDECGIPYKREFRLSPKDVVDFFVNDSIAAEVKIRGGKRSIYDQVCCYAEHDSVKELILITNVPTGFPPEVNGKPVYVLNLAKAWL